MNRRKPSFRRPKDILLITLRNLFQGDEIFCTNRTYDAIKSRVRDFSESQQDRRMATIPCEGITKIRRVV